MGGRADEVGCAMSTDVPLRLQAGETKEGEGQGRRSGMCASHFVCYGKDRRHGGRADKGGRQLTRVNHNKNRLFSTWTTLHPKFCHRLQLVATNCDQFDRYCGNIW